MRRIGIILLAWVVVPMAYAMMPFVFAYKIADEMANRFIDHIHADRSEN